MRRVLAGAAVVLALVLAVGVLGAGMALNSAAVRARVVEAAERAAGHPVRLDGPIGVAWSLAPAVSLRDVVVLNPPGFSREALATVRQVSARLALGPLLGGRIAVESLTVEGPDVLLERDASGRGNWPVPEAGPAAPAVVSAPRTRTPVTVGQVRVVDGRVAWLGAPGVAIRSLMVAPGGGPIAGDVSVDGVAFAVEGRSGVVSGAAFPVEVTATGAGVVGSVSVEPGRATRFRLAVDDLAAAGALVGRRLPALRDVVLTGEFGAGRLGTLQLGTLQLGTLQLGTLQLGTLQLGALRLVAGRSVFGAAVLERLDAGAASLTDAVQASGAVVLNGRRSAFTGRVGQVMPTAAGVSLRGLQVMSTQGDLAGDFAVQFAPRVSVIGSLVSARLDFDAGETVAATAPSAAQAPAAGGPAPAAPGAPAVPEAPAAPAVPGAVVPGPVIPARAVPFGLLNLGDADLRLSVGEARYRGIVVHAAEARVLLKDGRLRIDPAQLAAPGGTVGGSLSADANAAPPTLAATLRAPGLDVAGLAAMLGSAEAATGALDVELDLHAAGADLRGMAATLGGHLTAALAEGDVDNAALAAVLGAALRNANVPFDARGRSAVRCFVLRAEAAEGQVAIQGLTLETSRLRLEADGALDLGQETMDLHLRPVIRLGGAGIAVPVRLAGPFRSPRPQAERGVVAPGRFGLSIGVPAADACGPALAAARGAGHGAGLGSVAR